MRVKSSLVVVAATLVAASSYSAEWQVVYKKGDPKVLDLYRAAQAEWKGRNQTARIYARVYPKFQFHSRTVSLSQKEWAKIREEAPEYVPYYKQGGRLRIGLPSEDVNVLMFNGEPAFNPGPILEGDPLAVSEKSFFTLVEKKDENGQWEYRETSYRLAYRMWKCGNQTIGFIPECHGIKVPKEKEKEVTPELFVNYVEDVICKEQPQPVERPIPTGTIPTYPEFRTDNRGQIGSIPASIVYRSLAGLDIWQWFGDWKCKTPPGGCTDIENKPPLPVFPTGKKN